MSPRPHTNILTIALALKEPMDSDWIAGTTKSNGSDLRTTEDSALVGRLRAQRLASVLQAPQRGRQPPTGRPKYIFKIFPNADAPMLPSTSPKTLKTTNSPSSSGLKRIPFYLLASLAQAAVAEWTKQRANFSRQLDQEISSLESQLLSTRDRNEKKRLADALQTALHADEDVDAVIAKRVYAKLANAGETYSTFVDAVDWNARR
jgi:hypothetical protein